MIHMYQEEAIMARHRAPSATRKAATTIGLSGIAVGVSLAATTATAWASPMASVADGHAQRSLDAGTHSATAHPGHTLPAADSHSVKPHHTAATHGTAGHHSAAHHATSGSGSSTAHHASSTGHSSSRHTSDDGQSSADSTGGSQHHKAHGHKRHHGHHGHRRHGGHGGGGGGGGLL